MIQIFLLKYYHKPLTILAASNHITITAAWLQSHLYTHLPDTVHPPPRPSISLQYSHLSIQSTEETIGFQHLPSFPVSLKQLFQRSGITKVPAAGTFSLATWHWLQAHCHLRELDHRIMSFAEYFLAWRNVQCELEVVYICLCRQRFLWS